MNKKLITLAVAAAMAAPAAAMADATLYGKINMSIDYVDVDANALAFGPGQVLFTGTNGIPDNRAITPDDVAAYNGNLIVLRNGQHYKGWDLNSNERSSRIGVKGSEDLGGGLKAIYQIEFGVQLTNPSYNDSLSNGDNGSISMRNSFVGLAGNWGTFLVGRHDTPLKISTAKLDLFSDTLADYNWTIGFHDLRANNGIAYISPSFAGFQLAGAVVPPGGATAAGGVFGTNPDNNSIASSYSLAGIYSNGPFYASLAYENYGSDNWSNANLPNGIGFGTTSYLGVPGWGDAKDWSLWRAGLGLLDWNGFTLTGIYERHSNVLGAPQKSDMSLWQVQAGYAFGNNMIKGMYGQNNVQDCTGAAYTVLCGSANPGSIEFANNQDYDSWAVAFDHNFSKRTRAYLLYTKTASDQVNSDWSGWSLGMVHSF
jgi:predicted porin